MNTHLQVVVPQNVSGENGRTVLFISELPENITESELEVFFKDYKESIMVCQINRLAGRLTDMYAPKSVTATLIFKDHAKADEARKGLNMRKIRGKTVRIMWHEKDNSLRYNTQGNLFVKNISADVKPRDFYEKFLQFGDIISAKLCEDEDGNHNGYGYVSYYSPESADNAIKALNNKSVWDGEILEVARFQKKNERLNQSLTINKNLYVKNIPARYSEEELKALFGKYGTITWTKIMVDDSGRKSAILTFDQEDSVHKAREALNNTQLDGNELYVDTLMKKSDRKKILSSRIIDNNYKLNSQFKNCNLHIRNLPNDVEETFLHEIFSKYGEIKSVKIPKYILVTKVNNEFKEIPMSKGFGYVCFMDQEVAKKAKEDMTGKFLPKFESAKRPLLVDFFQPKYERKQMLNRIQQQYPGKQPSIMNPFGGAFGMPFNLHPNLAKHIKQPGMFPQMQKSQARHMPQQTPLVQKPDDPDIKYLQSLEDDAAKKDYLGEFIFKKIENSPNAQSNNFTIDTIGKITGMILGIDDINEIVDITLNPENLSARISEALSLLGGSNQ